MAKQFSDTQREILRRVQGTLPDSATPFADIAAEVGTTEDEVLTLLREMKDSKEIRRFGATLRHQKAGYSHNAMVAWRIPEGEDIDAIGEAMAQRSEISHCYIRLTTPEWTYNLYTMIHGQNPGDHARVVKEMSEATGLTDYDVLESVKELKKTSMVYF
ncbi:Lrp/AsnC family transcriptional regulator [Desulfovibrio ferrophilus]|uniref:siroheme decarboxylase n=1 Tax=Desulfovibrio ferrophilus TaxID=241368 RepID=A0A2Z6B2P5_9BACT|nr:Lrp/AsnC family transcriptional regulator [Desulfovibrio ferrophilus]BBD09696.1 DNA-binding protein [Desulfovibrio ferrophilus]